MLSIRGASKAAIFALSLSAIFADPVFAAQKGMGGGSLGYTCKSTESGRQCECAGSETSVDCQKMRDEVCVDSHIDACITNADGTPDICACKWKARRVPARDLGGAIKVNPLKSQ